MGADPGAVVGTIELEERDLTAALLQMSPLFRLRHLLAAAVVLLTVLSATGGGVSELYKLLPGVLVCGSFVAFSYLMPRFMAKKMLRAQTRAGDATVSYRFDADGVALRAAGATASFAYRTLVRTRETESALLLYTNPYIANIVPKRAFSPEDLERVRRLLPESIRPVPQRLFSGMKIFYWALLLFAFLSVWQLLSQQPR
jgi:hypothetical protein